MGFFKCLCGLATTRFTAILDELLVLASWTMEPGGIAGELRRAVWLSG